MEYFVLNYNNMGTLSPLDIIITIQVFTQFQNLVLCPYFKCPIKEFKYYNDVFHGSNGFDSSDSLICISCINMVYHQCEFCNDYYNLFCA